jgi:Protein of unknown function (DUF3309)
MGLTLLLIVIVLLVGSVPVYPHSKTWGYGPSAVLALLLALLLILVVLKWVPWGWSY